jgi:hypothetical protein
MYFTVYNRFPLLQILRRNLSPFYLFVPTSPQPHFPRSMCLRKPSLQPHLPPAHITLIPLRTNPTSTLTNYVIWNCHLIRRKCLLPLAKRSRYLLYPPMISRGKCYLLTHLPTCLGEEGKYEIDCFFFYSHEVQLCINFINSKF